jgi:hypothetical protein
MKWLNTLVSYILITAFILVSGMTGGRAATFRLPICSWPFEANGQGITNIATPDTNATYWVMPFDTGSWKTMILRGRYPDARFFNVSTYASNGASVASIYDSNIAPDSGSTNPFATTTPDQHRNYTVTIGAGSNGAANALAVAPGRLTFVVYRVYIPDQGRDARGGVELPVVSLVDGSGTVRTIKPCPFAGAETSLPNLAVLLATSGFAEAANFLQQILTAAGQRGSGMSDCAHGQTSLAVVGFGPPSLNPNLFPNPQTTYLETFGFCFQPNKVVVVRGKAPVFPNTYSGGSVFQPAFDGQIQLRYWSMCINDLVIPYPVVACQADHATSLDSGQFYTYVITGDQAPPPWLPPGTTWLPWGDTASSKNLIFRNLLSQNFTVAGPYVPSGVFCDATVFAAQGWQACFNAAGVKPPA